MFAVSCEPSGMGKKDLMFQYYFANKDRYLFYKILGKNKCEKWTSCKLLEFHTLSFVLKTIDWNQIWFELSKGNGLRLTFSLFNQKYFVPIIKSMC